MGRPVAVTDETIVSSLAAHPEATSAEVAEALGIGQSTAAKRLCALESAGSVRRTPGGRLGGRQVADRWSVAACPGVPEAARVLPAARGAAVEEPPVDEIERGGSGPDAPVPAKGTPAVPVLDGTTADGSVAPASGERLGRGELGSLVREYLAARPGESFGPAAVGKALGRSQGAVANSLAAMAAKGEVVLVGDKPRRYRIAG